MDWGHMGDMTEEVAIYAKATSGTASPEAWERIGAVRRARIELVSDYQALQSGQLLNANITHTAKVVASEDYNPVSTGGRMRMLKRLRDGQNFLIVRVREAGVPRRGGRTRLMSLALSAADGVDL